MVWNPSPEVAAARHFGKKFGADRVIIFYTTPSGQFGYVSYGQTPALCGETRRVAETLYQKVGETFSAAEEQRPAHSRGVLPLPPPRVFPKAPPAPPPPPKNGGA